MTDTRTVNDKIRNILVLSFFLHIFAAYFSQGFLHLDEHFQIIEFANYKLGHVSSRSLPWEFGAKIRPWFQPSLYWVIAKIHESVRDFSPFHIAFSFRLFSAMVAFVSSLSLFRWAKTQVQGPELHTWIARFIFLLYSVPYFHARTSSENLSASFFWLGFSLILGARPLLSTALMAGLYLGFSFECRFQSGIMVLSLLIWLIAYQKLNLRRWLGIFAGLAVSFTIGRALDFWGYDAIVFTPWKYFTVNMVMGEAARHGTSPWWEYIYYFLKAYPPISTVLFIFTIWAFMRLPRSPLTWVCLPFFVLHLVISHKEPRFLFPIAIIAPLLIFEAFPVAAWVKRHPKLILAFLVLNAIPRIYLTFSPAKSEIPFYKFTYQKLPAHSEYYYLDRDPYEMNDRIPKFYLPNLGAGHRIDSGDWSQLALDTRDPVYFIASRWADDPNTKQDLKKCSVIYKDLPKKLSENFWVERTKFRPRIVYECKNKAS